MIHKNGHTRYFVLLHLSVRWYWVFFYRDNPNKLYNKTELNVIFVVCISEFEKGNNFKVINPQYSSNFVETLD